MRDRSVNIVHGKIVLYRKNHKKNTKTICEKKTEFLRVTAGGTHNYGGALRGPFGRQECSRVTTRTRHSERTVC